MDKAGSYRRQTGNLVSIKNVGGASHDDANPYANTQLKSVSQPSRKRQLWAVATRLMLRFPPS